MLQTVGAPTPSKVPEFTLGFWLIKNSRNYLGETGGDAVAMSWLEADVMANNGYLIGSAIFISALIVLVAVENLCQAIPPIPLLVGDPGLHHGWQCDGRFCDPLFGHWIHRRIIAPVYVPYGCAWRLVSIRRVYRGRDSQHSEG